MGGFIEAAVGAAPQDAVTALVDTFLPAIEAEARTHERATLLDRLRTAVGKKGIGFEVLDDAVERWKAESPSPRHSYTPERYDALTTLAELKSRLEKEASGDGGGYEATSAFNRLAPLAGFMQAKEVFERWPVIRRGSRARFIMVNMAIDEGRPDEAHRLMQDYDSESDDRATWTAWTGGGTLRYFQARVRLDGAAAHRQAYQKFVSALAGGRENISSVMLEIDDIVPVIAETPNWTAMWDWLAEQLATTREHALGRPVDVHNGATTSDEGMIAALFEWAMNMPLAELRRHVQVGALRLNAAPRGKAAFAQFVRLLLAGERNEPAEALQLLLLDTENSLSEELGDEIVKLASHPDYAVAESATILAKRWGREAPMTPSALPAFYQIILEEQDEEFEPPQLRDPVSGAMRVEDPLGWTFPFKTLIDSLSRGEISAGQIRYRCQMLIERWGGLEAFGQPATDRLQSELHRLDMKLNFARPHVEVAARALRHVAGELRLAGLIQPHEVPFLLHFMGFPAPRLPLVSPISRPRFLFRPSVDDSNWQEIEEKWLQGVGEDVRPLVAGGDAVIVEVCTFHIRKARRTYTQERMRAPFLEVKDCDDLHGWFSLLPQAIWARGVLPLTKEPAITIARRFSNRFMPEVPQFQLVICPHWLRRLGWHAHPDNQLVFLNKTGEIMAKIVWWRDGGPVDVDDDVIWGEGIYLSVTPAGRAQIEAISGPLTILVNTRRSFISSDSDGQSQSRHAFSRD